LREVLEKESDSEKIGEKDLDRLVKCEFEFHNLLYEASHNEKLQHMLHELHGITARFWYYWVFSLKEVLEQFVDHNEILQALENRNTEGAREAMRKHIQNFAEKVKDKII